MWGRQARAHLIERAEVLIREKAIKRVKQKVARANRTVADYTEEELEDLVAAEEEKLRRQLWQMPVAALLVALGVN